MQAALDAYLVTYNNERPHQGRGMIGRTPYRAFLNRVPEVTPQIGTSGLVGVCTVPY